MGLEKVTIRLEAHRLSSYGREPQRGRAPSQELVSANVAQPLEIRPPVLGDKR